MHSCARRSLEIQLQSETTKNEQVTRLSQNSRSQCRQRLVQGLSFYFAAGPKVHADGR